MDNDATCNSWKLAQHATHWQQLRNIQVPVDLDGPALPNPNFTAEPEPDDEGPDARLDFAFENVNTIAHMKHDELEVFVAGLDAEALRKLVVADHTIQMDVEGHWRVYAALTECLLECTQRNIDILTEQMMSVYATRGVMSSKQFTAMAVKEFGLVGTDASALYQGLDVDRSGRVEENELKTLIKPLCENHTAMQLMRDHHVKARNVCSFNLFADGIQVVSPEEMEKLLEAMVVFHIGNAVLFFITASLTVFNVLAGIGVVHANTARVFSFSMYLLQSFIYLLYCVIFYRFFRSDLWSGVGLVLYTLGYLVIMVSLILDSDTQAQAIEALALIGLSMFVVGSVPFFLTSRAQGFKYNHNRAAVRGGMVFFLGSILFLASYTDEWGDFWVHSKAAAGYALFVWGRVEFFVAIRHDIGVAHETLVAHLVIKDLHSGKDAAKTFVQHKSIRRSVSLTVQRQTSRVYGSE